MLRAIHHLLRLADLTAPLDPEHLPAGPQAWNRVLRLAQHHRVAGVLDHRLQRPSPLDVPEAVRTSLLRSRHAGALRAEAMRRTAEDTVEALRRHEMGCLVLKGADLAWRVYPDPGMRPFQDVDILVHPSHADRALRILRGMGYRPLQKVLPLGWITRYHFHVALRHGETGHVVEIHWALDDAGVRVDVDTSMSPPTYAAYLAAHAARHGTFNARLTHHEQGAALALHPFSGNRLIWFLDLVMLLQHSPMETSEVLAAAGQLGVASHAEETLRLCGRLFNHFPLETPPPATRVEPRGPPGWIERHYVRRMEQDLGRTDASWPDSLPWLLTTNKTLHLRPIRLFGVGRSHVPAP